MLPKILREKIACKNWLPDLSLAIHVSKMKEKRGLKDLGL